MVEQAKADNVEVLKLVGAIAWAAQNSSAQADRMLTLVMNGLRHGGRRQTDE